VLFGIHGGADPIVEAGFGATGVVESGREGEG